MSPSKTAIVFRAHSRPQLATRDVADVSVAPYVGFDSNGLFGGRERVTARARNRNLPSFCRHSPAGARKPVSERTPSGNVAASHTNTHTRSQLKGS